VRAELCTDSPTTEDQNHAVHASTPHGDRRTTKPGLLGPYYMRQEHAHVAVKSGAALKPYPASPSELRLKPLLSIYRGGEYNLSAVQDDTQKAVGYEPQARHNRLYEI
jgi:hypothetical protein